MHKKALTKPVIYAVISSYNRGDSIHATIASLLQQSLPLANIILIDDGSQDGKKVPVIKNKRVTQIFLEQNVGVVWGRNLGLSHCSESDAVLIIDDDIVLAEDAVEKLYRTFLAKPESVASMPVVSFLSKKSRVWSSGSGVNLMSGQTMFMTESPNTEFQEIPAATSVLLVKMEAIRKAGWYDPLYYFCYEDADFYYRLRKKAGSIYCARDAHAYHDIPLSLSLDRVARRSYNIARGRVLFLSRFGTFFPLNLVFVSGFSLYYAFLGFQFGMPWAGLRYWQGIIDGLLLWVRGQAGENSLTEYKKDLKISQMRAPGNLKSVKVRQ